MLTVYKLSSILMICWKMELFLVHLVNLTKQHRNDRLRLIDRKNGGGRGAGTNHRRDQFT